MSDGRWAVDPPISARHCAPNVRQNEISATRRARSALARAGRRPERGIWARGSGKLRVGRDK
jgi:hypothetical protein